MKPARFQQKIIRTYTGQLYFRHGKYRQIEAKKKSNRGINTEFRIITIFELENHIFNHNTFDRMAVCMKLSNLVLFIQLSIYFVIIALVLWFGNAGEFFTKNNFETSL